MSEIEWTAKGRAYGEAIGRTPTTSSPPEFKQKVRFLRDKYGFPTWEIEKALMNNEGDVDGALRDLKAAST